MIIRADHVAGGAFIALGLIVFAISGDLPFGSVTSPGAGMMPKLMAGLMMLFALVVVATAGKSAPITTIDFSDRNHAALLVLITGLAIAGYQTLGFLITMSLLVFALLVVVERRNALYAAIYGIALT